MFEILFVIVSLDGHTIKEYFPESFQTVELCQKEGWDRASKYSDQILKKYPDIQKFDIECRVKGWDV